MKQIICLVDELSFAFGKLRPHALANPPAVSYPKVLDLGPRWVSDRAHSNQKKVALESDGWGSKTNIFAVDACAEMSAGAEATQTVA